MGVYTDVRQIRYYLESNVGYERLEEEFETIDDLWEIVDELNEMFPEEYVRRKYDK